MDKVEMALRLRENNFLDLNITNDILDIYINRNEAFELRGNHYPNNIHRSRVTCLPLLNDRRLNLIVESGIASDRNRRLQPYVKFSYNAQRLLTNPIANERFQHILLDLIPSGGYPVLLEEGYVLYIEFAADFRGVDVATLDAYCPGLDETEYFSPGGRVETICLHDQRAGRPNAFCMYDKKLSDRVRQGHIRRGPLTRIEARRRFNRTPEYRSLHLSELHFIPNPFATLQIFERERIDQTFKAQRHRNFLTIAQSSGVQRAIAGTRGADRERRERMLEQCRAEWWNPDEAWNGLQRAIQRTSLLRLT